jgi:hypothetical protein
MPALGGDARVIAPEGRAPKFSPDGRSIAYWTDGWLAARGVQSARRPYVVDVNGGTRPRSPATWRARLRGRGDRLAAIWRCSSPVDPL